MLDADGALDAAEGDVETVGGELAPSVGREACLDGVDNRDILAPLFVGSLDQLFSEVKELSGAFF